MVKKYVVEIEGAFGKEERDALEKGVELEDGLARALELKVLRTVSPKHFWVEVSIHEGRFHIVRRMFVALEIEVLRLIRSEFGPLTLGETKEGRFRVLNEVEIDSLFNALMLKR